MKKRVLMLVLVLTMLFVVVPVHADPPDHCPGNSSHTIPPGWAQQGK